MTKIKAIRKVFKKFQSTGTRFEEGDVVIINNNEIFHVFNNPNKRLPLSVYRYNNVDDNQIEKILDNSQSDD